MVKWNYKTSVCSHKKLDEALEFYGNDGWELVNATYLSGTYNLIFKKQKTNDK